MEPLRRSVAEDGTTKLLLTLDDGALVECVMIPERTRATVCVSTQVGCLRGCTFCLTATMNLVRNLTPQEIVQQVIVAGREAHVRNVVFMGMGEPLDNPAAVGEALGILTEDLLVAPRHITVSTVAPSPKAVERMADWPGRVAWSLHAADDTKRSRLVPTARHGVAALRDAFAALERSLFVEVTLIDGLNDGPEDAAAIAELFADFPQEVRFNLLPMNPIGNHLSPSSEERATAFSQQLRDAGYFCMRRRPRGQDQNAACGQLVTLVSDRRVTDR